MTTIEELKARQELKALVDNYAMKHECKITVLDTKCFEEYQEKYLADPNSGPCQFFKKGDTFLLKRTPDQDDFYHLMNGKFCGEAWLAKQNFYNGLEDAYTG